MVAPFSALDVLHGVLPDAITQDLEAATSHDEVTLIIASAIAAGYKYTAIGIALDWPAEKVRRRTVRLSVDDPDLRVYPPSTSVPPGVTPGEKRGGPLVIGGFCRRGHLITELTLVPNGPPGKFTCLTCRKESERRRYARLRAARAG